jgi:hypothetical protein
MVLDKALSRIQSQINEVVPTLELFVEENIQPAVKDCEHLQRLLVKLQEDLAVYTYHKREKELSPNFNLHARVSEVNVNVKKNLVDANEEKNSAGDRDMPEVKIETEKVIPPMAVAINDKFRFINELFKQNGGEYNVAMEQLNSLHSWSEAEIYLNSLKMIYNWKDNSELVNHLYSITKKRFL